MILREVINAKYSYFEIYISNRTEYSRSAFQTIDRINSPRTIDFTLGLSYHFINLCTNPFIILMNKFKKINNF